jgi:hypothetical protein
MVMSNLKHAQGMDERLFTGQRDEECPVLRFPTMGDLEKPEAFFDEKHADECIRKQQKINEPDKKDAIAAMKGIFALAMAEQNDLIKDGWAVDFDKRERLSPQVADAVVRKFREKEQ